MIQTNKEVNKNEETWVSEKIAHTQERNLKSSRREICNSPRKPRLEQEDGGLQKEGLWIKHRTGGIPDVTDFLKNIIRTEFTIYIEVGKKKRLKIN